ncbi:hypothetical protein KOR34_13690 [Posidoniimonas corsicana]|uniref:PEP-CTERM protein-sorting domain-containing protein n=1 Tax=Posidoniimonas corsicana TaxID=1938618 RepID=A0A5C5VEL6_9BACT|nr:hypothetical protein [Posidoniimonas corsicana]TWT36463.1 hypothetical protein KOR34_13690 [Posidoniimonas corsicana]
MQNRGIIAPLTLLTATVLFGAARSEADVLLYDFETDEQHREANLDTNPTTPPGWGSFGTITTDRGATTDASAGLTARFHAGDFDLPADLAGNWGIVDVGDRFTPYRKDLSEFAGVRLDMKFKNNADLPYVGPFAVEVGIGFMVPGIGEDESLQVYSEPITLTEEYDSYEVMFADLAFVQSGAVLENDLANNAFLKIRMLNTLESEGRIAYYYDEIYGITGPEGLPGDYNDDGLVDAADYTVWRDNTGAPAGTLPNDVDGGEIGAPQYATWRENYGAGAGPSAAGAGVPEPTALAIGALSLLIVCGRSRRSDWTRG